MNLKIKCPNCNISGTKNIKSAQEIHYERWGKKLVEITRCAACSYIYGMFRYVSEFPDTFKELTKIK